MVRKSEMPETSTTTKVIAETIRKHMESRGISQGQMGKFLNRSQSYVQTRFHGEQAWTTDDIDSIAKIFGLANGFSLIDEARGIIDSQHD